MAVRAKFKLNKIEASIINRSEKKEITHEGSVERKWVSREEEMRTLVFNPVYSSDKTTENYLFWDASPSGELRLGTVNKQAWEQFELNKEYYVDFTPAE